MQQLGPGPGSCLKVHLQLIQAPSKSTEVNPEPGESGNWRAHSVTFNDQPAVISADKVKLPQHFSSLTGSPKQAKEMLGAQVEVLPQGQSPAFNRQLHPFQEVYLAHGGLKLQTVIHSVSASHRTHQTKPPSFSYL
jgi:hypothetical protein